MQADHANERRYGLDWLRIGAFGLLILYHIGMYFVTWDWHVKSARPQEWLELPVLALNPWRLALLFLISGVASRMLLARFGGPGSFLGERSSRLLIPLLLGMVIFVVPQAWVELQEKAGYRQGFWHFWLQDYFIFGKAHGLSLPTWNHLWFLPYLWLYSAILALVAWLPKPTRARLQMGFDRLFGGWRILVLPLLWLWAMLMLVQPCFPETHALVDDVYNHAVYGFVFFIGVGLARSPVAWAAITRHWKAAGCAALAGYAIYAGSYLIPADAPPDAIRGLARSVLAWGAIVALLGAAQLHLHRDGPARRYLTEAIFPYYIAHQTIIVLAGFWLNPLGLGSGLEFAILFLLTVLGCAATYEIARRISWLRRPLGLKPRGPAVRASEARTWNEARIESGNR